MNVVYAIIYAALVILLIIVVTAIIGTKADRVNFNDAVSDQKETELKARVITVAEANRQRRLQWLEISEGKWHTFDEKGYLSWYEYCQKSPLHDTRIRPALVNS